MALTTPPSVCFTVKLSSHVRNKFFPCLKDDEGVWPLNILYHLTPLGGEPLPEKEHSIANPV